MNKATLFREVCNIVNLDSGLFDAKVLAITLARRQETVEAELVNYEIAENRFRRDKFCLLSRPLENARKAASWVPK